MEIQWDLRDQSIGPPVPVLQTRASSYSPWVDVPVAQNDTARMSTTAPAEKGGRVCNRSACKAIMSSCWYWNQSTLDWYCQTCAQGINNAKTGGTPYLCVPEYNLPTKADLS